VSRPAAGKKAVRPPWERCGGYPPPPPSYIGGQAPPAPLIHTREHVHLGEEPCHGEAAAAALKMIETKKDYDS